MASSVTGASATEAVRDLSWVGESPELLLGEDEASVDGHFEDPALALDQLGTLTEQAFELVRQTGGSRLVVSNYTVFDGRACHDVSSMSVQRTPLGGSVEYASFEGNARTSEIK